MANATGLNPLAFINPQLAAQQAAIQRQQALAAQLMQQGNEPINPARMAGRYVVPISPLEGLSKAGQTIAGALIARNTDQQTADIYKNLMGPQATPLPWAGEMKPEDKALADQLLGMKQASPPQAQGGAQNPFSDPRFLQGYAMSPDAAMKYYFDTMAPTNEQKNFADPAMHPLIQNKMIADGLLKTPQGTYISAGGAASPPPATPSALAPPVGQTSAPMSTDNAAKMAELYSQDAPQGEANVMPNAIPDATPASAPAPLAAADGKSILPNLSTTVKPDPSGTPKFKTENTTTGVAQTEQDQKDAAEGNKAFAATAQNLSQEKARLDNLIQIYKDVQSGTLTAQKPEFFSKLAALGFHDDPKSLHDLAGIQNATQNHILQVIQQIKDTNANAGGGPPTRVFGSEIRELLENGESAKAQPEALWNVIGQAKGLVDHHLDMVNGWNAIGGLGNRAAGGYTMRPDDYAQQFSIHHDISDYRDRALKDMGPFKGMPGNAAPANRPPLSSFMK